MDGQEHSVYVYIGGGMSRYTVYRAYSTMDELAIHTVT